MYKKSYLVCPDCHEYFRLEGDCGFLDSRYHSEDIGPILYNIARGEVRITNLPGFSHVVCHDRDDEFQGGQCECCRVYASTLLQIFVYYNVPPIDRADEATEDEPEFRAAYDDFLNEYHGPVTIAGIKYSTALALYNVDRIAYREGFCNWLDNLEDDEYPDGGRWQCPECGTNHTDTDSAAKCCAVGEDA